MGIENLTKAVKAAGYVMGPSEDLPTTNQQAHADINPWRYRETLYVATPKASRWSGEWRKTLASYFGLGAAA